MGDKLWNMEGRTRFFVKDKGGIQLLPADVNITVVEYMQTKLGIGEQVAYNMTRGYFTQGRIVFFHGSHYGAWSGCDGAMRWSATKLYRQHYNDEPVTYNGLYKGIPGEEWPPILYWDTQFGVWAIADGWKA